MASWPANAGFSNITHNIHKMPLNPWPKDKDLKEQGAYCGLYLDLSLDGFAMFPMGEILGWPIEQVHLLVARYRAAIRNPRNMPIANM